MFNNTGTVIADEGLTTITGQTNFANTGTINLSDGATGDVLTINSTYNTTTGATAGIGQLTVDVSSTAADLLVITGAASGTTRINVNPVGGGRGQFRRHSGGRHRRSPSTGTFVLGNNIANATDQFRALSSAVKDCIPHSPGPTPRRSMPLRPAQHGDRHVVPVGRHLHQLCSGQAQRPQSRHHRARRLAARAIWSRDKYGDEDQVQTLFGADFDRQPSGLRPTRQGIQVGVDYNFGGAVAGVTAGWQKAEADRQFSGFGLDAKGWNIGLYGIIGSDLGFYGGLLAKYDKSKADARRPGSCSSGVEDLDLKSTGIEGEVGYRFGIGNTPYSTSAAGLPG